MIDSFRDQHRFLSNFYPCHVEFFNAVFPSVEHAYQAAKVEPEDRGRFTDPKVSPAEAKKWGNECPLPPRWDDRRLFVMHDIVQAKFLYNENLRHRLLMTGDEELVEGNVWGDKFWGRVGGYGENWLGRILMSIRTDFRQSLERLDF
jgi:ribA/ribD-fused uncharacterized protein